MGEKEKCPEKFNFEDDVKGHRNSNSLILHNDDVHSFEYVIDVLVKVCDHDVYQAEQCAYITHYKGKCDVKRGAIDKLAPLRYQLIEKGLQATID
ncbi:MAG TPA: ATP-dependent Clp protease adaptor ClpS [Bacteroidales bacterium]|jgi:ATP-dependent Clp protease adaptor protein ClpS|nr:ATP-dependent Clp protease adaptor ClpS [Bacteroidales bacterium]